MSCTCGHDTADARHACTVRKYVYAAVTAARFDRDRARGRRDSCILEQAFWFTYCSYARSVITTAASLRKETKQR
jgi:hypothetical protein